MGELSQQMVAGIELGGTKTVVAWGRADGTVEEEWRFPTTVPEETLGSAVEWLMARVKPEAIGVGAFGPIRVNPRSADYGTLLNTPKSAWVGYSVKNRLERAYPEVPVKVDTDVNAALWAEVVSGAAKGATDAAYITIGTGIGAGILSGGRLVHGCLHPEFGHLKVPRFPGDEFAGLCPFHGDCLEGLASGPAIRERWGRPGVELPADHPAWDMEAWYLAHGIQALLAILSPSCVIVGGGVSQAEGLHEKIGRVLEQSAGDYFGVGAFKDLVVPPALGQEAGIRGALLLAGMDD